MKKSYNKNFLQNLIKLKFELNLNKIIKLLYNIINNV